MRKSIKPFAIGCLVGCLVGGLCVYLLFLPSLPNRKGDFGQFTGDVKATWSQNGRDMTLDEDFAYQDPDKTIWVAESGSTINGASIPRAFWSAIGGPYEGPYRNASVIHDVACDKQKAPSAAVHRMFYYACRCGGASESKAKAMYYAVARFGPAWKIVYEAAMEDGKEVKVSSPVKIVKTTEISDKAAETIFEYFEKNNPNLEEIPELVIIESP